MLKATSKRTGVKVRLGQQREPKVLVRRRNSVSVREERRGHPPSRRAAGGSVGAVAVLEEHAGALPEASCMVAPSLTWMVFITPLASTAIFPATLFTPCLNCVMSGPEGSTPSKPELLPVGGGGREQREEAALGARPRPAVTFPLAAVSKQVCRADGGAPGQALQFGLGLVLERPTEAGERRPGGGAPAPERRLTSPLLSRPKNMSEEMALALANFCRASLDSETAAAASAFLLLGSLGADRPVMLLTGWRVCSARGAWPSPTNDIPLSDWLNTGDGHVLFRLLLLQGPRGGEGGAPSFGVPPGPKTVPDREGVVLVPETANASLASSPLASNRSSGLSALGGSGGEAQLVKQVQFGA